MKRLFLLLFLFPVFPLGGGGCLSVTPQDADVLAVDPGTTETSDDVARDTAQPLDTVEVANDVGGDNALPPETAEVANDVGGDTEQPLDTPELPDIAGIPVCKLGTTTWGHCVLGK